VKGLKGKVQGNEGPCLRGQHRSKGQGESLRIHVLGKAIIFGIFLGRAGEANPYLDEELYFTGKEIQRRKNS